MEDVKAEDIDFVQVASSKSKNIGHNKFQAQLQEANEQIDNLQSIIDEKNAELELFKNNMREFQLQMQKKNIDIAMLHGQVSDLTNRFSKLNIEFESYKQDSNQVTQDTDNDKLQLINLNKGLNEQVTSLTTDLENTSSKYEELKNKYQLTLTLLDSKTNEYKAVSLDYDNVTNELNLYKELNSKQLSTIDMLKEELQASQNESSILRTRIFEKDTYLGELNKKYTLQQQTLKGKRVVIEDKEQDESSSVENTQNTEAPQEVNNILVPENIINITSRPIKVTDRKLKVSRR
jgi:chromosome segregation ATPase